MKAASLESSSSSVIQSPDDSGWSWRQRWILIGLIFAAQIGFLFLLGDRKEHIPKPAATSLGLIMVSDPRVLTLVDDPTFFALPHRQGFGGQAWAMGPVEISRSFRWSEPPRFLSLPAERLVEGAFTAFKKETEVGPFELEAKPTTVMAIPLLNRHEPEIPARSSLSFAGEVRRLRLLNPPELPILPSLSLLTNTVIQVSVSSDGLVRSAVQLSQTAGGDLNQVKADHLALQSAWGARFEPLARHIPNPTIGLMIFEWRTAPLSETNAPSASP